MTARFERGGLLMIDPAALGQAFPAASAPHTTRGEIAIVRVTGPLVFERGADPWLDYGTVRQAVETALSDSQTRAAVIDINSPGGDVWGCFEAAAAIRKAADAAGKPLIAYVSAQATSAAYALACVADEVIASDTAVIGSIGVIASSVDLSEANERAGVRITVVTTGARKADGHPAVPMSDEARNALQRGCDAMAGVFFQFVRRHRGIDPEPLEAATFVGEEAVSVGLADGIGSLDDLIEELRENAEKEKKGMAIKREASNERSPYELARDLLEEAANDPTRPESERRKARRALAKLLGLDEAEEERKPVARASKPTASRALPELPPGYYQMIGREIRRQNPEISNGEYARCLEEAARAIAPKVRAAGAAPIATSEDKGTTALDAAFGRGEPRPSVRRTTTALTLSFGGGGSDRRAS